MLRFIVQQAVTNEILSRDLEVVEPKVVPALSGPASIEFKVMAGTNSFEIINFKAYSQIISVEISLPDGERRIIASGITQPCELDSAGNIKVTAVGWSEYPKGLPWLQNYNPIAIDPFAIVQRIWNHIQSYPTGNIGVTVQPASSGTLLLPGFSFDGTKLNIDFFAIFVRAVDYRDCGNEITSLARDIPFDFLEVNSWNANRTAINRTLQLAYPRGGIQRQGLSFILGENVIDAKPLPEAEIEYTSGIIVKGWFPGKVYEGVFNNDDPNRYRRVVFEDDVSVNSRERAAIYARRKLTKRQIPKSWSEIVVDMYHPNAPFGQWQLGDDILIRGRMQSVGDISEWHRIIAYQPEPDKGVVTITVKHVDAFNYDPIDFEG